jgi:hypothetical protein
MTPVKAWILCVGILLGTQSALAQTPMYDPNNPPPEWVRRRDENLRTLNKINGKDERGMIADRQLPRGDLRIRPVYTKEELAKIKELSNPKPEDFAAYKDFLQQPQTGMFRIFPDIGCQSKFLLNVEGDCENNFYGIKSHTFREGTRFDRDIDFIGENILSQNFFAQGIFVPLGDVDLGKLGAGSEGMKYLTDLSAPSTMADARKRYSEFLSGVEAGGYRYTNNILPEVNTTYGFRIIAYRIGNDVVPAIEAELRRGFWPSDKRRFLAVQNDKDQRLDVTVAFRIVKKDEDGSITVLWKEFARQIAPKLTFGKRQFYLDLKEQHWENEPSPYTKVR